MSIDMQMMNKILSIVSHAHCESLEKAKASHGDVQLHHFGRAEAYQHIQTEMERIGNFGYFTAPSVTDEDIEAFRAKLNSFPECYPGIRNGAISLIRFLRGDKTTDSERDKIEMDIARLRRLVNLLYIDWDKHERTWIGKNTSVRSTKIGQEWA
jgi:hypothetical protein